MTTSELDRFIQRAEAVYEHRWRCLLEAEHLHQFVAIEPESEEYFLGDTFSDALRAARHAHPGRLAHVMRVGHPAAVHFGVRINCEKQQFRMV